VLLERKTSRRDLLKTASLAGAFGLLPGLALADGKKGKPGRKRLLRIAHFTDAHVQPAGTGSKWLGEALDHANSLTDAPSLILFGGDQVFDGTNVSKDQMASQWVEFHATLRNNNSLPVKYCLGNHDIWGWSSTAIDPREPEYGKQWARDTLQMDRTYYSFDEAGWHFVVLDSIARFRDSYIGKLGHQQLEWLDNDLTAHADKPTLVMSHIPLMSACATFFGNCEVDDHKWHVPGTLMHIDARHTKDLFLKHSNVKVCVSGHIHLVDRVDYNGVSYLCNGAISGNWWKGNFQETPPGYSLIDLFDDGTWRREYVKYGWTPDV